MAHFTKLNRQEIQLILTGFDITEIDSYQVLRGGSENTNFLVIAKSGKYVLTICEQKTKAEARQLANLLEHFEKHHFRTSRIIRNSKNEAIVIWNGKPVMIKIYLEGKVLKEIPIPWMKLLGIELGKLHKVKAPSFLPDQINYGKEVFGMVEEYASGSQFEIWLKARLQYITPYISSHLPKALIHSDVFCDNVIIQENNNSLVIMDFEEAAYYYRLFDIGMTIIGTCGEKDVINLEKAKALLDGYRQEIVLTDLEIQALQAFTVYAGAAMTFWRHSNFNYVNPDLRLSDHYLGLKVLTDFIENQPSDQFIEQVIS